MKTITHTALALGFGLLTTAAFAENSPATPPSLITAVTAAAPAPDRTAEISSLPPAGDAARVAAEPAPTARQIAQLEHDFSTKYRAGDGLAGKLANQTPPDLRGLLTGPEPSKVVFSQPPSPAFYYTENATARWYPSITVRFDWGRSRRG
jgi:hypothetical protein